MKKIFVLCLTSLILEMWDVYAYEPGTYLLVKNGEEVMWGNIKITEMAVTPLTTISVQWI